MTTPPCFPSDDQFEIYMRLLDKQAPAHATYCWDCTREYQQRMKEDGLCRHPETTFVMTKSKWDSGIQGVRSSLLTSRPTTTKTTR